MSWVVAAGAAITVYGVASKKKGKGPQLGSEEQLSIQRKSEAEGTLSGMFQERAKDPFKYVMPLGEQKYYDERQADIYGEERDRQQQSLMGAMNRMGTLGSGATGYNLMRFGQQTLRDKQQFYFQDRAQRLREREGAVQATYGMGMGLLSAPTVGMRQTDMMNQRTAQANQWKNRWSDLASNIGGQMMGYGLGSKTGAGGGRGGSGYGQPGWSSPWKNMSVQ